MLEAAKREKGGNARVVIFDWRAERIKPKGFSEGSTMRGDEYLETISFSETPDV